jgi:nucleoside-diphosphate-sugar epimerase
VHVSTQSVIFTFDDHLGTDENRPIPARHRDHYSATKAEAERLVLNAHGGALFTSAVRPHIIWGPRDTKIAPRIEALARAGQLFMVGGGRARTSLSYVDNVIDGLLLCAEVDGAGGEAFFVVDREPVETLRFISRLCESLGAPPPKGSFPYPVAFSAATMLEWIWKLTGKSDPPPISRYGVAVVGRNMIFRWEKAHRLLGYVPAVDFEEGMRRIREWKSGNTGES